MTFDLVVTLTLYVQGYVYILELSKYFVLMIHIYN